MGAASTAFEVTGYWLFLAGFAVGLVGVVAYFLTPAATTGRSVGYALAALAPALTLAGAVLQFPLRKTARHLTGLGVIITFAVAAWFLIVFPEGWSTETGNTGIIVAYLIGLGIVGAAGALVPRVTKSEMADTEQAEAGLEETRIEKERTEAELEETRAEKERTEAELDDVLAERDQAEAELEEVQAEKERIEAELGELEEARSDEAFLAAQLESLRSSQSQFELYEDRGGQWRWRLRHRNGNLIAGSGEGYTRQHDAQNGMQAVRRDAVGASVVVVESEDELPAEASEDEFVSSDTTESRAEFESYEDAGGEYRWRLQHENGNIIATSGAAYTSSDGVESAIEGVREYAGPAEYLQADPRAIEVYADEAGEWRWRLVHRNGTILATSSEGYADRGGARRAIDRLREGIDGMIIEVFEDSAEEFRWRLLGGNGEIGAVSGRGYATEDEAEEAVENVRRDMPEADLLDIGEAVFEVYEGEGDEWRWRLRHRNGEILAISGEGYAGRSGTWDGIESVKQNAPGAGLERTDTPE